MSRRTPIICSVEPSPDGIAWERFEGLTERQNQLVTLVSLGKPNKEIGAILKIAIGTVKQYMNCIFKITESPNRTALAMWGIAHKKRPGVPIDVT